MFWTVHSLWYEVSPMWEQIPSLISSYIFLTLHHPIIKTLILPEETQSSLPAVSTGVPELPCWVSWPCPPPASVPALSSEVKVETREDTLSRISPSLLPPL